jgi:hypothetical protein
MTPVLLSSLLCRSLSTPTMCRRDSLFLLMADPPCYLAIPSTAADLCFQLAIRMTEARCLGYIVFAILDMETEAWIRQC